MFLEGQGVVKILKFCYSYWMPDRVNCIEFHNFGVKGFKLNIRLLDVAE